MKNITFNLPELSMKALDELPLPVVWFDKKGNFFAVNDAACRFWGYDREAILKMSVFDINPNMNAGNWDAHWEAKQIDSSTFESSHKRKNGEIFPVEITDNFVQLDGAVYSCAVIADITQRKEKDRQARLSDFTVQNAADAIFWISTEGHIKEVNTEACIQYGYNREEFKQLRILDLYEDMSEADFRERWKSLKQSGQLRFETEHRARDGKKISVEVSSHFVLFEEMEFSCSMVRDISDRKRKEAALRGALMEIKELKEKLEAENNYLQEEIELQNNFGEIISNNVKFKRILKQIEQVAPTSSTVLVTGESGTGKELIARALHQLSRRSSHPIIKVNCAALPANLIESELFGHEKGAFTGALSRKVGKFELADEGTLFLDEIGEMPIELQPKLLRAIQEGEIERLGGIKPIKVNVRLIAATNRDLEKEIGKSNFREDLYYRLNVFPIHSIPLRERPEDIPLLVQFFCEKLGNKLGKKITDIPQKVIDRLMQYDFPGNVRELENLIERGIITSRGSKLIIGNWFNPKKKIVRAESLLTLEEIQRQHLVKVLKHTNWRVSGVDGAAQILDMRPTTLHSKIERLGIKRSNEVRK